MTQSETEVIQRELVALVDQPTAPHQIMYCDQMSAMAFGAFTSRFTLAIEDHAAGNRTPLLTVVMPTNTMMLMAKQIIDAVSNSVQREALEKAYNTGMATVPATK